MAAQSISAKNILLFSYLFSIPIMFNNPDKPFFPAPIGGKVQISDVIFVIMFFYCIYSFIIKKLEIRYSIMTKFLILYLLFLSLSFITTINVLNTFTEILGVLYLILTFFILHNLIRTKNDLLLCTYAIISSLAFLSITGFLGLILLGFFDLKNPFARSDTFYTVAESLKIFLGDSLRLPRVEATLKPLSSMLGAYLTMSIGFLIAFHKHCGERARKYMLVIIVASAILVVFTFSRTLLSFVIALYVIIRFSGRPAVKILSRPLLAFAILLFVAFNVVSIWRVEKVEFRRTVGVNPSNKVSWVESGVGRGSVESSYFHKNENDPNYLALGITYSYNRYLGLKLAAAEMYKRSPIFGVGLGNFNEMARLMHGEDHLPEWLTEYENAHNTVLNLLAESGIPGITGFVLISVFFLRALYGGVRSTFDGLSRNIILGVLAGFVGMLIVSVDLVIINFRFMWAALAIGFTIFENIEQVVIRQQQT